MTATRLRRFCTTYSVRPTRSSPSPLVIGTPPRSTRAALPVAGSTRNRAASEEFITISPSPSGVGAMPLALFVPEGAWTHSPVSGSRSTSPGVGSPSPPLGSL